MLTDELIRAQKAMKSECQKKIQEFDQQCQEQKKLFTDLEGEKKELEKQIKALEDTNKELEDKFGKVIDKFEGYVNEQEEKESITARRTETAIKEFNVTMKDTD